MNINYKTKINVLVVDDHNLFRQGVKTTLKPFKHIKHVYEAENGKIALQTLTDIDCDVVLMDIMMPELDGVYTTREIVRIYPDVNVIALTMSDEESCINRMLEAGASGYLLKNTDADELMKAISAVYLGQHYYSEKVSGKLYTHLMQKRRERESFLTGHLLSARELEVLELICDEYSSDDIAKKLCLSKRTIDGYRKVILKKSGSHNTAGLVKFALRKGYYKDGKG